MTLILAALVACLCALVAIGVLLVQLIYHVKVLTYVAAHGPGGDAVYLARIDVKSDALVR